MHDAPSPRFILPIKQAIKAQLMVVAPSMLETNISFDSVERDRSFCATIMVSRRADTTLSRSDERLGSGRTGYTWRGDDGKLWERHQTLAIRSAFEIQVVAPSLEQSTSIILDLAASMPRFCFDPQPLAGLAVQPAEFRGNSVELTCTSVVLPEDTTSVSKSYRSFLYVRADGHLFVDRVTRVQVSTCIAPRGFSSAPGLMDS